MYQVRFDDGTSINFEKQPTEQDVNDAFEQIKTTKQPAISPEGEMKSGVSGFGQTIGTAVATGGIKHELSNQMKLDDMTNALALQISKMKKDGKDTSRAEEQYKMLTGSDLFADGLIKQGKYAPSNIYGAAADKTTKQIVGEGLSTLGATTMGATAGTSLGRMAIGTTQGAIAGAGSSMSQNKDAGNVLADTLKGASIGFVVSGALEGIGYGLRKMSESNFIQNKTANVYTKELQPSKKDLALEIERTPAGEAFRTIGAQIRDQVDEFGKPIYVGTYKQMRDKAIQTLSKSGDELNGVLSQYDDVIIKNKDVSNGVIDAIEDNMGMLTKTEKKIIQHEVERMGSSFNPTEALKYKRMYDSKIPDNFWSDTADRSRSVAIQARYLLRDGLRKAINQSTDNAIVPKLNETMGIAMDVRRLTSSQLAQRATLKVGGGGGTSLFRYLQQVIWDDFLFNPKITTSISQGLNTMGQNVGPTQTILRGAGIQEASK